MAITQQDLDELVAAMERGRASWISGHRDVVDGSVRQADDMTIFGPFGGTGPRPGEVTPEQLRARQAAVSAQFHGGDGSCELIRTIVDGDLAVLVMVERSDVLFEGREERHPWVLRTTQVFRKVDDGWVRIHRHADPLILQRPLEATLQLLDGA